MNILLVEDEDLIRIYVQKLCKKRGHRLDTAHNGADGELMALENNYDAIVLDIVLPKRNGLDVCRRLRQQGITTPVLILSSKDAEHERVAGLDAGADDYMIKPFSGEELLARLRALSRRPRRVLPVELSVGSLVVSPSSRRVTANNTDLSLRPKEYSILEYLLKNQGKAVTRDELLHNIWGIKMSRSSNRLDVSVRHLRSKIEAAAEFDPIVTVRGVGYMIE